MAATRLDAFDYALLEALPLLRSHAMALTRSAPDAEDLVQDTVLAALRHRDKFAPGSNMIAWLKIIARNQRIDGFRRQGARIQTVSDDGTTVVPFPETQHERLEAIEALKAAERLSPVLREAALDLVAEKTVEEIAIERRLPEGTVKTRRCRARDAMRAHFGLPKLLASR